MKNEILLFQPEVPIEHPVYLPYSLLPVAGVLDEAGYDVKIIDARFEDYSNLDLKNVIFCGITSFTGIQIDYALKIARAIREKDPDMKIVWGGIHASLMPQQTCKHPLVDIVVKGEAEITVLELADALKNGKPLSSIKGITYEEDGQTIDNEPNDWFDMNKQPLPPFHLIERKQYHMDSVNLNTSRGCPFRCTFCFNRNWNKSSYRYQTADKVVDQMEWAMKMFPGKSIHFNDDNFFVREQRVKDVCNEIIKRGIDVEWFGMCRADHIINFDEETLALLKKSGLRGFGIGGESGSPRILKLMKKGITVEILIKAVQRCKDYGITPIVSFMAGFPGETVEDVYMTLDLIDQMRKIHPRAITNGIFVFTPYPGTEAFDAAVEYGFKVPDRLEDWGGKHFSDPDQNPWYTPEFYEMLDVLKGLSWLIFSHYAEFRLSPRYFLMTPLKFFLKTSARIRWRFRFFKYGYEWKLYSKYVKRKGHLCG